MTKIKLLPPDLINKIAAGEVVERPSSVVKELLENSIDAGATEIKVTIEKGGINLIEVSDNGSGMSEDDAKLAFVQHATSKILTEKDLANITSLGFRGEALASINSVARTNIITKTKEGEGISVSSENDRIIAKPSAGINTGTKVTVLNIFEKIPARRKFLKSESSEYRKIIEVFIKTALINPGISFQLIHNKKESYNLAKASSFHERIIQVFKEYESDLIELFFSDPSIKVEGYISHPSGNRKDKKRQFLFINNRPINNPLIAQAIKSGYGTNLMTQEQPVFFVKITLPTDQLDVNVHPRKDEVRFTNEQLVFKIVFKAVRKALETLLSSEITTKISPAFPQVAGKENYKSLENRTNNFPKERKASVGDSIEFTRSLLAPKDNVNEDLYTDELEVLQVFDTYIITEQNHNLLIIDQHAAAERITFEKIYKKFMDEKKLPSQKLLLPEEINLHESEIARLKSLKTRLESFGFEYSLKSNSISILAVPDILNGKDIKRTFMEILEEIDDKSLAKEEISFLNKVISSIACHTSIRAGVGITTLQAKKIVEDLLKCNQPYSCPHGRPIIWSLTNNELEKQFKRKL